MCSERIKCFPVSLCRLIPSLNESFRPAELIPISILLIALILIFLFPAFFQGKVLFGGDAVSIFYPWRAYLPTDFTVANPLVGDIIDSLYPNIIYAREAFRTGRLPTWNPYITSGQPFATLLIHPIFYPLNILYYTLPPLEAFAYHTAIRLFIAGLGCYLLGRHLSLSWVASLTAAIVFAFNGFQIVWLQWPHTYVLVWLPFLFIFASLLLETGRRALIIALSLVLVIMLLGGFLPMAVYSFYLVGAYLLWKSHHLFKSGHKLKSLIRPWLALAASVIIAFLLVAPLILPMFDNTGLSGYAAHRAQDVISYRNFYLPWQHLINYLIPKYYGNHIDEPYWGIANYIETTGYVGILPLFLSCFALLGFKKNVHLQFFGGVALVSLAIVFGLPLIQPILTRLPILNVSINTRLLGIAAFAIAVLAGFGLDQWLQTAKRDSFQPQLLVISTFVMLTLGLVLATEVWWSLFPNSWRNFPTGIFDEPSLFKRTMVWAIQQKQWFPLRNLIIFGVFLITSTILAIVWFQRKISPSQMISAVLIMVTLDLFIFGIDFNPFTEATNPYPTTPAIDYLKADTDQFRIAPIGTTLFGNSSILFHLETITGHSITHSQRYAEFLQQIDPDVWNRKKHGTLLQFDPDTFDYASPFLNLLNVKYLLSPPLSINQPCGPGGNPAEVIQPVSEIPVGELKGGRRIGQTFRAKRDNLFQVCLLLATYNRLNHQKIQFHLKADVNASDDLAFVTINAAELIDNQWYTFEFLPIPDSKDKEFYFYLESPASRAGDAITAWAASSDVYSEGTAYENDQPVMSTDLAFGTKSQPNIVQALGRHFDQIVFEGMVLLKNRSFLPRAYAVHKYRIIPDSEKVLAALQWPEFDPTREVILEDDPEFEQTAIDDEDKISIVKIITYQPDFIELQAEMSGPGFVVLSEIYYPGWVAEVDGVSRPIYRANYLFRAIPVPAGTHRVILRYAPGSFELGLKISGFGFLILISLVGWPMVRQLGLAERRDICSILYNNGTVDHHHLC